MAIEAVACCPPVNQLVGSLTPWCGSLKGALEVLGIAAVLDDMCADFQAQGMLPSSLMV